jgi:hypothetical protein
MPILISNCFIYIYTNIKIKTVKNLLLNKICYRSAALGFAASDGCLARRTNWPAHNARSLHYRSSPYPPTLCPESPVIASKSFIRKHIAKHTHSPSEH